jgi:hypothetical protein
MHRQRSPLARCVESRREAMKVERLGQDRLDARLRAPSSTSGAGSAVMITTAVSGHRRRRFVFDDEDTQRIAGRQVHRFVVSQSHALN